jgi:type II secretory pathway pseudopilin PulG
MNTRKYNHKTKAIVGAAIIAISLLSASLLLSLQNSFSANAQNQKSNQSQSQSNKTTSANNSAPPIATCNNYRKPWENNSKVLANNTNIGNPNAGKAASAQQKITSGTPTNGLPSNPTKGSQKTSAAIGSGQNKTGGTSNMTNMTAGKSSYKLLSSSFQPYAQV